MSHPPTEGEHPQRTTDGRTTDGRTTDSRATDGRATDDRSRRRGLFGRRRDDTATTTATTTGTTAGLGHDEAYARGKFGGLNLGAAFFGWLVAIAVAILLTSIVGAVATAVGVGSNLTPTAAQQQAGTIGLVAAVVLLVVLGLAYLTGGYVAGRMSRFNGGRQGVGVWVIGLLVTVLAVVLGGVFGAQYNLLDRVSLPRIPLSTDQLSWGGIIAALAVLVVTLLGAVLGGRLGRRYHRRVDRALRR